MRPPASANVRWYQSTKCATGNCIRVAAHDGQILFGSTLSPDGPVIAYTNDEFQAFIAGAKQGDFDHLLEGSD